MLQDMGCHKCVQVDNAHQALLQQWPIISVLLVTTLPEHCQVTRCICNMPFVIDLLSKTWYGLVAFKPQYGKAPLQLNLGQELS